MVNHCMLKDSCKEEIERCEKRIAEFLKGPDAKRQRLSDEKSGLDVAEEGMGEAADGTADEAEASEEVEATMEEA